MNQINTLKVPLAGFQPTSLIDYPGGEISSVVFLGGCNFKCGYCHNPTLVTPPKEWVTIDEVLNKLNSRRKWVNSVVISGGEPLLYGETLKLIEKIKENRYKVKLDTNGSFPDRLEYLLNNKLIDYIAIDLKTIFSRYYEFSSTGTEKNIKKTITLLDNHFFSDYEFRTTLCPIFVSKKELKEIASYINNNRTKWFWQQYKADIVLNPVYKKVKPYQKEFIVEMQNEFQLLFSGEILLRGIN